MYNLTKAQNLALEEINDLCSLDYKSNPLVIIIRGFSGAGKSKLAETIRPTLEKSAHLILEPE